jgi:hypothetical protein
VEVEDVGRCRSITFSSAVSVAGSNFDLWRYVMSTPIDSSVSSDEVLLAEADSDTLYARGRSADHPREQPLDAVHPRSLPAEVIADLQHFAVC